MCPPDEPPIWHPVSPDAAAGPSVASGMPVTLQFHDGRARALVDGGSATPKRKVTKQEKQGTLL